MAVNAGSVLLVYNFGKLSYFLLNVRFLIHTVKIMLVYRYFVPAI